MCSFIHLQQKAVFAVIHVHQMDTHRGIHLLPPYGLWFSLSFWRSHTWARADPMQRDLNLLFFLLTLLLDSALWVGNRRVSMNMTPWGGGSTLETRTLELFWYRAYRERKPIPGQSLLKAYHSGELVIVERRVIDRELCPVRGTVKAESCLDLIWLSAGFHWWRFGKDVKREYRPKPSWRQ